MSNVMDHPVDLLAFTTSDVPEITLDFVPEGSSSDVHEHVVLIAPNASLSPNHDAPTEGIPAASLSAAFEGDAEAVPNFAASALFDGFADAASEDPLSNLWEHEVEIFSVLPGGSPLDDDLAVGVPPELVPENPDDAAAPDPPRIPPRKDTVIYLSPNVYGSEADTLGRRNGPKGVL